MNSSAISDRRASAAAFPRAASAPEQKLPADSAAARPRRRLDALLYLGMVALLAAAFAFSRAGLYDARSDLGYWMGVVGAVMMVLLFAYPLRKRSARMARWGQAKIWFVVHMVLGVMGPVLVLAHATFRVGSLNAGVALFSMLIVAASGVAGRFVYLRIHQGLGGQLQTLASLRAALGLADSQTGRVLRFTPQASARLQALQASLNTGGHQPKGWLGHLHQLLVLPWQLRRERWSIRRQALADLRQRAAQEAWSQRTLRRRERQVSEQVTLFVDAVQRAAQLSSYTRVFSLWHVLHVPFVFLMVVCAVAHVVAVHAY